MAEASGFGNLSSARLKKKSEVIMMSTKKGRAGQKRRSARRKSFKEKSLRAARVHARARVSVVRVCAAVRARDALRASLSLSLLCLCPSSLPPLSLSSSPSPSLSLSLSLVFFGVV